MLLSIYNFHENRYKKGGTFLTGCMKLKLCVYCETAWYLDSKE
jgi:hypothetical protein